MLNALYSAQYATKLNIYTYVHTYTYMLALETKKRTRSKYILRRNVTYRFDFASFVYYFRSLYLLCVLNLGIEATQ